MNDAEKRLHKLAQRDSVMFKRAESMGLQVDHAALELYIRKNFLNQAIDHQEIETEHMPNITVAPAPLNDIPLQDDLTLHQAANHTAPEALSS